MKIGIIGAGHIGSTLARKLTSVGHQVRIANSRGPLTLTKVSAETGARPVTVEDAVKDVELVIVTIPQKNVPDLPKGLFANVPDEVVVIDTGNYYPMRDGRIDAIEDGEPESVWVASILGRRVVKVFNNIVYFSLAECSLPKGAPGRVALPVAGDNERDKRIVLQLVDELGFDGVDAGSLAESWRQQPGTLAYCTDLPADKLRRALEKADRQKAPAVRDASMTIGSSTPPAELIGRIREMSGASAL